MLCLKLAWRNIWRNKRRTWNTVVAVTLNTTVLILTASLLEGMVRQIVHNATQQVVGDAQVHARGYTAERSIYNAIEDPGAVLDAARRAGIGAAARSYGYGLLSLGSKSAGAMLWGVDPASEKRSFELATYLLTGRFLADRPGREIVLGRKLARSLHAEVGSEVVAVVQAADGSLGNELFVVQGILKAAGEAMDRSTAILHRKDFEELLVSEGRIHEIALTAKGQRPSKEVAAMARAAARGADVRSWRQLLPAVSDMLIMFDAGLWIYGMIFFLAAGLGVMNTMLMAIFERRREFGVLKALGTSPLQIVRDVALEALLLGLFSTILGALLGVAGAIYLRDVGLDLSMVRGGEIPLAFAGVAFDPVWRGVLDLGVVLKPLVGMWVICVLAAIYPAAKAARLDPVRAMQRG